MSMYFACCTSWLLMCARVGARNGLLYTLNAQVPDDKWREAREQLQHAADSFRVLDAGAGTLGYPQRLR